MLAAAGPVPAGPGLGGASASSGRTPVWVSAVMVMEERRSIAVPHHRRIHCG
jgi:hypothetical protein